MEVKPSAKLSVDLGCWENGLEAGVWGREKSRKKAPWAYVLEASKASKT